LTRVLFDPTQRDFFASKGKKLKNLEFLGRNFPNPSANQRWLTQPEQQKIDLVPSLVIIDVD